MGNLPKAQNNPYANIYNPGWRNNQNFSWNQRPPHNQNKRQPDRISTIESTLEKFMQHTIKTLKNQWAVMKNLETQLGQLSRQNVEKPSRTLPSNIVMNLRE